MLPLHFETMVMFETPIVLDVWFTFILLDINYMFNMIGGLILVSHAPKRWYSACGFWGCDRLVSEPLVIENLVLIWENVFIKTRL
ncbi:hypothetical protein HanPSC8_Chr12g0530951 [Helianthus annuus]|nr:hypothetical protein HanPSC8_Chr12g0530951 [Helianthus annuus]